MKSWFHLYFSETKIDYPPHVFMAWVVMLSVGLWEIPVLETVVVFFRLLRQGVSRIEMFCQWESSLYDAVIFWSRWGKFIIEVRMTVRSMIRVTQRRKGYLFHRSLFQKNQIIHFISRSGWSLKIRLTLNLIIYLWFYKVMFPRGCWHIVLVLSMRLGLLSNVILNKASCNERYNF